MRRTGRLEITTRIGCSINCVYCPQKLLATNYFRGDKNRKAELSFDDFKTCIDKLPKGTRIDFSGMAEPWLNKRCTDMVLYASEKGFPIAIYTTLVGMTKEDFERIKTINCEEFILHIPDDKSNAHIQVTRDYIGLLSEVVLFRKEGRQLVTGYSCHGSIHPDIIKMIPPDSKLITELIDRAGNLEDEYIESKINIGEVVCINCNDNINHNVLLPDGTIVLCCMDYGMKHILGNLLTDDYETIMNSKEARRVRRGLTGGEEQDVLCRTCTNARSIHELFDEFVLYRDWCQNLLKSEEIKDIDLKNYKDWVGNYDRKVKQQDEEYIKLDAAYNERTKELFEYKDWVEKLQCQIEKKNEILLEQECKTDIMRKELNHIKTWRGYKFLARINKEQ